MQLHKPELLDKILKFGDNDSDYIKDLEFGKEQCQQEKITQQQQRIKERQQEQKRKR